MSKIYSLLAVTLLIGASALADTVWANRDAASALATALSTSSSSFSTDLRVAGAMYYIQSAADNYTSFSNQFNTSMASGVDYPTASAQFAQVKTQFLNLRNVIQAQGTAIPYSLLDEFYNVAYAEKQLENAMVQPSR